MGILENIITELADSQIALAFNNCYPESHMSPINISNVPQAASDKFESKSKQFILPEDYRPNNFSNIYKISHRNGSHSFVATQEKTYGQLQETEKLTFIVDLTSGDELQGYGELRFNISNSKAYFRCKPFVGYTDTEKQHQRKGLGTRRLYLMNALATAIHSAPLNSDTLLNDNARRIWERLVKNGVAHRYMEGKNTRYAFTDEMPGWHSSELVESHEGRGSQDRIGLQEK